MVIRINFSVKFDEIYCVILMHYKNCGMQLHLFRQAYLSVVDFFAIKLTSCIIGTLIKSENNSFTH